MESNSTVINTRVAAVLAVLLIVCAGLAVGLPRLLRHPQEGYIQMDIESRMIILSVQAYREQHGRWPESLEQLSLQPPQVQGGDGLANVDLAHPLLDPWGNPYRFGVDHDRDSFWLRSDGRDGKPDTRHDHVLYPGRAFSAVIENTVRMLPENADTCGKPGDKRNERGRACTRPRF